MAPGCRSPTRPARQGQAGSTPPSCRPRAWNSLPIITESGQVIGTGTPAPLPAGQVPTVIAAAQDNDSPGLPAVSLTLSIKIRTFNYSSDLRRPKGTPGFGCSSSSAGDQEARDRFGRDRMYRQQRAEHRVAAEHLAAADLAGRFLRRPQTVDPEPVCPGLPTRCTCCRPRGTTRWITSPIP